MKSLINPLELVPKSGNISLEYPSIRLVKQVFDKYFVQIPTSPELARLKKFSWPEVQSVLYPAIKRIEVRTINGGNAPKNLNYEDYEKPPNDGGLRLIAVGGLSLSRGLTLEGLCTTYYYRNSTMYDTLMQMGRWFGYRQDYLDVCKVWMPNLSMEWYSYISMATDELRAEVDRMQNLNMTPKDFGLAVRSDIHGLFVTARNKMRSAMDYEITINLSGEVIETRYLPGSADDLQHNLRVAELLIKSLRSEYDVRRNDPKLALKHPQFLSVEKEVILEYLPQFKIDAANLDFVVDDLLRIFAEDTDGLFDRWDILIAQGAEKNSVDFAGLEGIFPVRRSFAVQPKTGALQMSGKNSRLGSKDLAKGGLTKDIVREMEGTADNGGKAFSETFYFKTGVKRNPLLVIYPVLLSYEPKEAGEIDTTKKTIVDTINYPIVGLSIGIPLISGIKPRRMKFKINRQKWLEIHGADSMSEFDELDNTIPEE